MKPCLLNFEDIQMVIPRYQHDKQELQYYIANTVTTIYHVT